MTIQIDTTTEFGARVLRRLADEQVAWLTTVSPRGAPVPSLIWFWWDGERALMYSQPDTPKLRNIAANPRVTLNMNSVGGGDVIVLTGTAEIGRDPADSDIAAYLAEVRRADRRERLDARELRRRLQRARVDHPHTPSWPLTRTHKGGQPPFVHGQPLRVATRRYGCTKGG